MGGCHRRGGFHLNSENEKDIHGSYRFSSPRAVGGVAGGEAGALPLVVQILIKALLKIAILGLGGGCHRTGGFHLNGENEKDIHDSYRFFTTPSGAIGRVESI